MKTTQNTKLGKASADEFLSRNTFLKQKYLCLILPRPIKETYGFEICVAFYLDLIPNQEKTKMPSTMSQFIAWIVLQKQQLSSSSAKKGVR